MPKFQVWCEANDESPEDGVALVGTYSVEAAEKFVQDVYDAEDRSMANDEQSVSVFVRREGDDRVQMFEVHCKMKAEYTAVEVL